RRKLVLIRRDQTEHLIMTGGPVDVLVETGIDTRQELRSAAASQRSGFGGETVSPSLRPARHLGRAANEG
ncbi:MAG: flagellar biosynthesis protein FliO, partial [Pseudomonadota bacterium]